MRRLFVVVVAVVSVACGIPLDETPRALDIELETDVVDPIVDGNDLSEIADLYFVTGDTLVSVTRQIADAEPVTVVRALLRGPSDAEGALSIRSAIPPETRVLDAFTSGRTATVDLSPEFTLVGGDEEILAVAQIVATLAGLEGIDGVVLAIEGTQRPAPVAEGQLVERPLVPADFAELFIR